MKISEKFFVTLCVSVIVMFSSCSPSRDSIKRMQSMEEGVSNPSTKEELEEAIKKYEARAMDLVLTEAQEGTWYKVLGLRYLDEQMYGKAYEAFQKAVYFYPNNANLYYYIGMCAAYIANSEMDFDATDSLDVRQRRNNYYEIAEQGFLQALSIDPRHFKAMYSLGVLYVFQLEEYKKAVPYLEKFLQVQKKDTNAMFVLANAYYHISEFEKAIGQYDQIIKINKNAKETEEAQNNKKIVLDAQYAEN